MKVSVVSRKLIKPCKPTPSDLCTYKISLIDEVNPSMHVTRIFFYESDQVADDKYIASLEESLSQVLPLFYPLAGRYNKEEHYVNCNDKGAAFLTTEVDCPLHQFIGPELESEQLDHLAALQIGEVDEPTDPILAVQINRFQCGGLAIGVCTSHRVFDSCSQTTFLKAWANAATNGGLVIRPDFDLASYFPLKISLRFHLGSYREAETLVFSAEGFCLIRMQYISYERG
ncbi:UNVERIFIED_CONTAM: 3'-N-debenzoyl-2'-deoxytaxol N-benzoyltransferase [Sesamum calycinum]|uniref:3'-N-debenzoyl-2'-deoxytaxol N-benzoyltransferase n=1 Tax=Sesamum calycinum TaxID=2727403 RepID=A0AAW2R7W7_9LAMI